MFVQQIETAIATAHRGALDTISQNIWRGLAAGALDDDDAQRLAELIHAKRELAKVETVASFPRPGSIFPPRRKQVSPDRRASIERRRRLASSGPLPPPLAASFTTSEQAVLRIVADECRSKGACTRSIAEIAARAGVSRTTVQNTMRQARTLGLVKIEERRITGAKNLPNRITIVCKEWKTWIERGPKGGRVQKSEPHGYGYPSKEKRGGGNRAPSPATALSDRPINNQRPQGHVLTNDIIAR